MKTLDPWRDAQRIADHLRKPGATLAALVTAEAWCERCRRLKPTFDRWVAQGVVEVALWLDLEDHAELLAGFVPGDLPWWLIYQDGHLTDSHAAGQWPSDERQAPWKAGGFDGPVIGPDLWSRLARTDWADQ